jgi:hypothetical protein
VREGIGTWVCPGAVRDHVKVKRLEGVMPCSDVHTMSCVCGAGGPPASLKECRCLMMRFGEGGGEVEEGGAEEEEEDMCEEDMCEAFLAAVTDAFAVAADAFAVAAMALEPIDVMLERYLGYG